MTITDILEQAQTLSVHERKELAKLLIDSLEVQPSGSVEQAQHSILELAGLGADIWTGIDAQEYVNQLRDEWKHRS